MAVRAIIGYYSVTQATSDFTATDIPQLNMPNLASVYCEQEGNKLEIRTAADGSQNGICVFLDGSTCDEWAYFRGECSPAAQKSPTPAMTFGATALASNPPLLLTLGLLVALIIVMFGFYGLSGAGIIRKLPWLRPGLLVIGLLYGTVGILFITQLLVVLGILTI